MKEVIMTSAQISAWFKKAKFEPPKIHNEICDLYQNKELIIFLEGEEGFQNLVDNKWVELCNQSNLTKPYVNSGSIKKLIIDQILRKMKPTVPEFAEAIEFNQILNSPDRHFAVVNTNISGSFDL